MVGFERRHREWIPAGMLLGPMIPPPDDWVDEITSLALRVPAY
jgi:hypothetical protein